MKTVDVIINSHLNTGIGPVQTVKRIRKNKDFFKDNGYEVQVFSADDFSDTIAGVVRKHKTPFVKWIQRFLRYLRMHSTLYGLYRANLSLKSDNRMAVYYNSLNRNADVVVFHDVLTCYAYLKQFKKENQKVCCFTHSDGFVFEQFIQGFPKIKGTYFEKRLSEIANYVFNNIDAKPCIAKIEEKNLLDQYPQLQGKTCLVVNAIDDLTEEQKVISSEIRNTIQTPKYRMVCSGGFNTRKGQDLVVEALHRVAPDKLNEFRVVFLGEGPDRMRVEEMAEKYGLSSIVTFKGLVPNEDVYKYYAESNIGILISENEGLPISLIESIRSGLAVISTNVSGIPEVVHHGENGLLISYNYKELVPILNSMDQYDWDAMGKASRKLFEDYYIFTRMRQDYLNMIIKADNA